VWTLKVNAAILLVDRTRYKNGGSEWYMLLKSSLSREKVKRSRYMQWMRLGGEEVYTSSYLYLTSALDGDERSASRPGCALPPGKGPPVPIVQEDGWAPEPVWTQGIEEKSSASVRDRTPSSSPQSVTTRTEMPRLLTVSYRNVNVEGSEMKSVTRSNISNMTGICQ
jgi:hypothetical protein